MKNSIPEFESYSFKVEPLKKEFGGGFILTLPDLPGCMSDGTTYEEAIENTRDAFRQWINSVVEEGKVIPKLKSGQEA